MTESLITGLLAAVAVIGAAAVGSIGVSFGQLWKRISELEGRVSREATREASIWWWALSVKDMYYRFRTEGSPDLPPIPEHDEEP